MSSNWLFSDLNPKKSEKFEFRKNFVSTFFSVKTWPKKRNFHFFCPPNFRKIAELNSTFEEKIIFLKFPIFQANIPLKNFEFNFAFFQKLGGQKK